MKSQENDEIEKRFLVTELSPQFPYNKCSVDVLKQGYINSSIPDKSSRVRIIGNIRAELAVKLGKGAVRKETEFKNVNIQTAEFILEQIADFRTYKKRYRSGGKYSWTVDFFENPLTGIIIAEKEFKKVEDIPADLELPSWIGKGFDVTNLLTTRQVAKITDRIKASTPRATLANLLKYIEQKRISA